MTGDDLVRRLLDRAIFRRIDNKRTVLQAADRIEDDAKRITELEARVACLDQVTDMMAATNEKLGDSLVAIKAKTIEECARLAESMNVPPTFFSSGNARGTSIAAAIRTLGKEKSATQPDSPKE